MPINTDELENSADYVEKEIKMKYDILNIIVNLTIKEKVIILLDIATSLIKQETSRSK